MGSLLSGDTVLASPPSAAGRPSLQFGLPPPGKHPPSAHQEGFVADRLVSGTGAILETPPAGAVPRTCLFFRRGEYWTVGYSGQSFALHDLKGLAYIRYLLEHPGEEFHAFDLIHTVENRSAADTGDSMRALHDADVHSIGGLGDAGEMLDAEAKKQYARKLAELRSELDDLREKGDADRADEVQSEIDFIAREITRAVGKGGRDRRAGSVAERARLNVSRAIWAACEKIASHDPAFSEMLSKTIRTGSFCSFVPDPRVPAAWQLDEATIAVVSAPSPVATPISTRPPSSFLSGFADSATFVGRTAERGALDRALSQTMSRAGRVVMIDGPAGVGKTRLTAELCAEAASKGALVLSGNCYDREDAVPFTPFVEMLEAALEYNGLERFRQALGDDAAEVARLLPQLRRLIPDLPPPMDLPPEQSRRILFRAIGELLIRTAANTPLVLVIDDLHWADEGTFALLGYLSHLVLQTRSMIVGTYRDFELHPAHPLAKMLDELVRLHLVERVSLRGLPENAVAEMLAMLSGRKVPASMVALFHSSTEGNPFFVEELYRHLAEQGRLFDAQGELRADLTLDDADVPETLRLVIGRRLSRLKEPTLKTLGPAAIIGRSFTFELLRRSAGANEDALLDHIEEAERAGLISSSVQYPEVRFRFSHDLIRQVVMSGITAARRQRLHLEVAGAIEHLYPEAIEDRAGDLAHHLWQAGAAADPARTINYLSMTASQAVARSANLEAIAHLEKALKLIPKIPAGPLRNQLELGLRLNLGQSSTFAKGYAAPEVQNAFDRARELCAQLGDTPQLSPVLYGLWGYYLVRGEYQASEDISRQLLNLGERQSDQGLLLEGHITSAISSIYWRGPLPKARAHFEKVLSIYNPRCHQGHALIYGQDPGVLAGSLLPWALWFQGYPDQAISRQRDCLALARSLSHKWTLAYALTHAAAHCQFRRDIRMAKQIAEEGIALSAEWGFPYLVLTTRFSLGWALNQSGQPEEAVAVLRNAKDACRALGAAVTGTHQHGLLADALGNCRRVEEGLDTISQGLDEAARTGEEYYEAELHRLKGELLLKLTAPDEAAAEQAYLNSLEVARRQGARSWELRAAMSLYRLKRRQGDEAQARTALLDVYKWFTEGFDTPDLRDAKMLLDGAER